MKKLIFILVIIPIISSAATQGTVIRGYFSGCTANISGSIPVNSLDGCPSGEVYLLNDLRCRVNKEGQENYTKVCADYVELE